MRNMIFLLAMVTLACRASESIPTNAHIGIDQPQFDEEGRHIGWHLAFSASIDNGNVRYWKKEQGNIDYKIANEKLVVVKQDVAKLAKEILNNEHKNVGRLYRIQFSFTNNAGKVSGLYFYDNINGLPQNVSDIVEAIKLLTGNT